MQYVSVLSLLFFLWVGCTEVRASQLHEEDENTNIPCRPDFSTLKEEEDIPPSPDEQRASILNMEGTPPLDIPFPSLDPSLHSDHWGISQPQVEYLFEHSPNLISIGGPDSFKRVNRKWQEVLGWSEEEVIGVPLSFFMPPGDVQMISKKIEFAHQRLFTRGFEARIRCKDGSYRWFQWLSLRRLDMPLAASEDRLVIGHDITQQKEQEAARLKTIEDSRKEITSLNKILQDKNKILEAISDIQSAYIDKEALPPKNIPDDNFSGHYRPLEIILQHFIHLSGSEYGFIGELFYDKEQPFLQQIFCVRNKECIDERTKQTLSLYKKKGNRFCNFNNILGEIITTKKPLIINNFATYPKPAGIPPDHLPITSFLGIPLTIKNKVVGLVALANKHKGYSDELLLWLEPLSLLAGHIMNELKMEDWRKEAGKQQIAREQAEAANEAKSAFLAHMSHEIRTPLTGILGLLDLIREEQLLEEDRDYLKAARMSGMALMSLLNDVLDIAKIEAHQVGLEKVDLDPVRIVQELIQIFSSEAKKQETSLTLTTDSAVPPHLIGDPMRLRQILSNLIGNAIKFTKKGSVAVTLKGQECPEKDIFCLSGIVTDTGIGMTPETLQHLFQPFMQADNSVMRQFGGTGLGLYITKALCELMRGEIKVMSQFGVGSTFQFTVKMEVPKTPISTAATDHVERLKRLPNARILIAEDNLTNQRVLKAILQREGCSVTIVANGREALEAVQEGEAYDLILMDGQMPEMDGLEATRRIRELFDSQTLPIIGVTAHALATDRERFLNVGMNGYLTKPIQREALKAEILRCLEEKDAHLTKKQAL